jgi:conjugative relaxase-like TrwC/TraI family protein
MLVVRSIGQGAARYYFRGQAPGRWLGRGSELLGLEGTVTRGDLTALLDGRRPGDGHFLPDRRPARRRSGWDLTFAAPKSLSVLTATVVEGSQSLVDAHQSAIADVFSFIESSHLAAARTAAPNGRLPIAGAVAADFQHRTNAAGEPHVHSHVLIVNLGVLPGGEWSALSASDWWPARRSLAAIYQLGLRHHLRETGWDLDWRLRPDGLADLADVPRAAVRATSYQGRAAASLGQFRSRELARPQPWRENLSRSGFRPEAPIPRRGPDPPGAVLEAPRGPGSDSRLASLVEARLLSERSTFRRADVLVALAASCAVGLPAPAAEMWAEEFLRRSPPATSTSGRPRWTTGLAAQADQRLVRMAGRTRSRTPPTDPDPATAGSRPERTAVNRLTKSPGPIEILAAPAGHSNLLAHATLIDNCRDWWDNAGLDVSVRTGTADGSARWQCLTGLRPYRSGRQPEVLIVDHADRLPTPHLLGILSARINTDLRTVLIEGGCRPRLGEPLSAGFVTLGQELGRLDPGPDPDWSTSEAGGQGSCRLAVARLLETWAHGWLNDTPGVLVGLGADEVRGLNRAARSLLVQHGHLEGQGFFAHGRDYRSGDRVVALQGLGPGHRRGTTGLVLGVDPRRGEIRVRWNAGARPESLGKRELASIGHGYAVTPSLAARLQGPLLMLGDPADVPVLRHRVICEARSGPGAEVERRIRSHRAAPGLSL